MRMQDIKRRVGTVVLVGAMLQAAPAMASFQYYVSVKGSKQGQFKAESKKSDNIPVTSVSHDMNSGISSGKRQHGQITITKEVDAASPMFMQAFTSHEVLTDVTITITGSGAGKAKVPQTVDLQNAVITAIHVTGKIETITFQYDIVHVTWTDGGKTATDDWLSPS
jgi:type VI secretion system secreted protein Hcp